MAWIEYLEDRGTHKKGSRVDTDDSAAKTLIDVGIAKAAEAPNTSPTETVKTLLLDQIDQRINAGIDKLAKQLTPTTRLAETPDSYEIGSDSWRKSIPATAKRYGTLKSFSGKDGDVLAYRFGVWALANYGSNFIHDSDRKHRMGQYIKLAEKLHIPMNWRRMEDPEVPMETKMGSGDISAKASNTITNTSSGFLVPDEFENNMIVLKEKYGVFRREAKKIPMNSDTRSDPRRRGGLTATFVGEDQAGTQTTKTWDRVRLTAKKLMVLSKWSNELNEDAILNIGDDLADEIAYAFAKKEDDCGFLGDGTSTYGGIVGIEKAFLNVDATIANILGVVVQSGNAAYSAITLGDINKVVGTLPEYADDGAKWYTHKYIWGSVFQKLAMAAGGNRVGEITGGARTKELAGYEVVVAQSLRKTWAANQLAAVFGDLSRAARFGDRRQTTIAISDVALNSFEQDEIAIRGTERFDIVIHDVGESSAGTARDSVQGLLAGPIVALFTAAA